MNNEGRAVEQIECAIEAKYVHTYVHGAWEEGSVTRSQNYVKEQRKRMKGWQAEE